MSQVSVSFKGVIVVARLMARLTSQRCFSLSGGLWNMIVRLAMATHASVAGWGKTSESS
jgi:hypothetical protein